MFHQSRPSYNPFKSILLSSPLSLSSLAPPPKRSKEKRLKENKKGSCSFFRRRCCSKEKVQELDLYTFYQKTNMRNNLTQSWTNTSFSIIQQMSESIETKQQYLREKILEKGHDAEAFMLYCEEVQGEIDLQGWTFAKLKKLVNGFLGEKAEATFTQQQLDEQEWIEEEDTDSWPQNKQQTVQKVENEHPKKSEIVFSEADWGIFGLPAPSKSVPVQQIIAPQNPKVSMSPPSISPPYFNAPEISDRSHNNNHQSPQSTKQEPKSEKKTPIKQIKQPQDIKVEQSIGTSKILEVGKIQINVIKSKQLQQLPTINDIKIIKTQQKTRNFLQGDYTLYHIQFCPGNHIIQRKFNDFRKLRNILQKIYPHVRLPYLEPEGWLVNNSEAKDQETLNKYKYMIIEFLKYITIRNSLLRKSKIVRIFTGFIESNPTDFKKYQNIAKPKIFSQLCLPNGNLQFSKYESLSPVDKYMTNTQILAGNVDALYEKLRKSMETLFYNYQHVSKSLTEVSGIFQSLQHLIQRFNFQNQNQKDLRVYEGVKQVCMKMKQTIDIQYGIFRNQIQSLFKYERDNITTLKQINQTRGKMFNEYARQGLLSKKTSEFVSKGQTFVDGSISIDEPSRNNKNMLSVQNMFWAFSTLKNVQDYWSELRFKINEKLTIIAYQQLDMQNSTLNFWNGVIKKCVI